MKKILLSFIIVFLSCSAVYADFGFRYGNNGRSSFSFFFGERHPRPPKYIEEPRPELIMPPPPVVIIPRPEIQPPIYITPVPLPKPEIRPMPHKPHQNIQGPHIPH